MMKSLTSAGSSDLIERLKPESEFSRNVLTLMTGTTIAQAIPIAISPILTRIYTPEDFGVFALFVAITSIFGSIASGRYELAIILPKKDEDAINIFALGFIITTLMSSILLLAIYLFHDFIASLLRNNEIENWLYFAPIVVFFIGLFNLLSYFNNRKKNYKDIANTTIVKSIIMAIVQLSVGFIKNGAAGLIGGQLASQIFANVKLFKNILQDKILISKISKLQILAQARRYKNFPKFSMWGILANSLSFHLTNILISFFYTIATLGFYSLVQRVLGIPSTLVGSSIGQIFFQQASHEKKLTGKAINTFRTTLKKLVMIGLLLFISLFFIIEALFAFIFGEEWRIAGTYAQILIPMFFLRFVSSSVSSTLIIFEKHKMELLINLILISVSILLILLSHNFLSFLYYYTTFMGISYTVFLVYYHSVSKGSR